MIGIITAAGEAIPFSGMIKCLLPVGHCENILQRDIRLFGDAFTRFYVVTHHDILHYHPLQIFRPKARRFKLETIISTAELWTQNVMILHGDVYFSDLDYQELLKPRDVTTFFYNANEHFALFMPYPLQPIALNAMATLVNATPPDADPSATGLGSLLAFYQSQKLAHNTIELKNGTLDFDDPLAHKNWHDHRAANVHNWDREK